MEIDQISEGIAILILSLIGISLNKISQIEILLSTLPKNVKRSLLLYVAGLVVCERKSTTTKMAERLGHVSHDSLTRALHQGSKVLSRVPIAFIKYCMSQTTGYLIIDDFLVPKRYSSNIDGVYNEFDHVDRERTRGMRIVMILWSNGHIRIPIAWQIWHKEHKIFLGVSKKGLSKYEKTGYCLLKIAGENQPYKTKNDIALELLLEVISQGVKPSYVTFDSWYSSKRNLQMMTENVFQFPVVCYSRLKQNRNIIYQGCKMSLTNFSNLFSIRSFNHKHGAYIKAVEVDLCGYGEIKLLLVRKDSHNEPGKTKLLFSTNVFDSASTILLRYRSRWAIETTFRDLKQNLNIGSCQARSLQAQKSHIALSLFAFVSLELLPELQFQEQLATSLGEKKLLLSRLSIFSDVEKKRFWLFDFAKPRASFISLLSSGLAKVNPHFDFAFESLYFSNFQRTA